MDSEFSEDHSTDSELTTPRESPNCEDDLPPLPQEQSMEDRLAALPKSLRSSEWQRYPTAFKASPPVKEPPL